MSRSGLGLRSGVRTALLLALALLLIAAPRLASTSTASPVYLTVDTGFEHFKFGPNAEQAGFPNFAPGRWGINSAFEWSPSFLERRGLWLFGGFSWQSIDGAARSAWPHSGLIYADGLRWGIRGRWRLTAGGRDQ